MIQFPEIDFKSERTRIMVVLFLFSVLFLNQLGSKILIALILLLVGISNYSQVIDSVEKGVFTKSDAVRLAYNNSIENILTSLKMYKKDNPVMYRQSMYYWTYFMKEVALLEKQSLYNYPQHFDKAFLYLQKCVNAFHSIGPSITERTMIDAIEYNDFESNKRMKDLTDKTNKLYKEGYSLLYNLSIRFNKQWKNDPHIYNKQIIMDYPLPNDSFTKPYDFYV